MVKLVAREAGKPFQLRSKLALLGRKEEVPLPELIVERRTKRRRETPNQIYGRA